MATNVNFTQLPKESLPFNRVLILKAGRDLTDATNAEAQEFRAAIPAGYRLDDLILDVPVLPQDASDTAFDDVQITVGDSSSATAFLAATQIAAKAGSPVSFAGIKRGAGSVTLTSSQNATAAATDLATAEALANALKANYNQLQTDVAAIAAASVKGKLYAAADYLKVVVTPKTGKALASLDLGEIRLFCAFSIQGQLG